MNNISQHISYLLLTRRKVSVPGLGSFFTSYDEASFDATDGIFYPSKIRINFASNSTPESSSLTESLMRKLNIDFHEANRMVNDFVSIIKTKLNSKSYCKLEGIGYLFLDNAGKLSLKDTFFNLNRLPVLSRMRFR